MFSSGEIALIKWAYNLPQWVVVMHISPEIDSVEYCVPEPSRLGAHLYTPRQMQEWKRRKVNGSAR